jgi:hypothetical protein
VERRVWAVEEGMGRVWAVEEGMGRVWAVEKGSAGRILFPNRHSEGWGRWGRGLRAEFSSQTSIPRAEGGGGGEYGQNSLPKSPFRRLGGVGEGSVGINLFLISIPRAK